MTFKACRPTAWLLGWILIGIPQTLQAADSQYREFRVLVNGKESGKSQIVITKREDGSLIMVAQTEVKINQLLINHHFKNMTTEWWKENRLWNLKASTTENKERTEVTATTGGNHLRIRINSRETKGPVDVWPTSFWKLPDARYHNNSVNILEVDSGKQYVGRLQYIGTENMNIANQAEKCYHFRVTGIPNPVDLWFDRFYLLVREEFTDSGQRISVGLINIHR